MGKCCCFPLWVIAMILVVVMIVQIVKAAKKMKLYEYERCGMDRHMIYPPGANK